MCTVFFLRTLGYTTRSVLNALQSSGASACHLFAPKDKRGYKKPLHALSEDTIAAIDAHIEEFHPSVSHYKLFITRINKKK